MITAEMKLKAANSLMKMRTFGNLMFPKVYVCGNKTCAFVNPLRRLMGYGSNYTIEEMSIHEAFQIVHGRPLTPEEYKQVDWNMNQQGAMFNGNLYCSESDIKRDRQKIAGGRPEIVEMTPMDENWQEKRDITPKEQEAPETMQEVANRKSEDELDREMLIDALNACNWVKRKTAVYLDIKLAALNKRIKKYNIIIDKKQ